MIGRLLILFFSIPVIELLLLIEVGRRIGTLPTLAIVVVTAVFGASLARTQGFLVLRRVQHELAEGRMPGDGLLEGVFILVGSLLLLTPGLLSDVIGFIFLIPWSRRRLLMWFVEKLRHWIDTGSINIFIR